MADNVVLNAGAGGDAIRTVDKGGIEAQVVILDAGGGGAESLWTGSVEVSNLVQTASNAGNIDGHSSTVTLAANAVFTGTPSVDMLLYSTVRVSLMADQPSAADGLQIQFSQDDSNWDFVRKITYPGNVGLYAVFNRLARYMRIVYTNGGTAQGAFRLQCLVAPNSAEFARQFLGESTNDTNSAVLTKAVVIGRNTNSSGATYDAITIKDGNVGPVFGDTALVVTQRDPEFYGYSSWGNPEQFSNNFSRKTFTAW